MPSTTFVDYVTPVPAVWLNEVNTAVFTTVPNNSTHYSGSVTAIAGQTVFTVPFTYTMGNKRLQVYINGVKQLLGSSYNETTTTSITFTAAVPVNAVVEFNY